MTFREYLKGLSMNTLSILRASFRENRKRAQYKSGNQVLQITKAVNYEGQIAEDATVHGDAGCGEKRPANNNRDANLISHNMKPSTEGQAVSPDAPLNPLWKDSHIRAHFPEKRPNGTFDNGPQEKKFSWRVLLSLLTAFGLAVYSVGKALGAW